jgi:hypothetical protein
MIDADRSDNDESHTTAELLKVLESCWLKAVADLFDWSANVT